MLRASDMKALLASFLALSFGISIASAQTIGPVPGSGGGGGTPGGSSGQLQFNNAGAFGGFTVGGDGTLNTGTGSLIVTKTNGVSFGSAATLGVGSGLSSSGGNIVLGDGAGITYDATNRALTVGGATVAASTPVLSLSQTWTNGGVTYTGARLNITPTAAGPSSLFFDIQNSGTSRFSVGPLGQTTANLIAANGSVVAANSVAIGWAGTTTVNALTTTTDTALTRKATANIQLGLADAGGIVAQTLGVQSVSAGQTNVSGANWTIRGSQSTGSGTSGDIIIQTGGTGAAATAQNSLVTALTIKGATQAVRTSAQIGTGGYTVSTLPAAVIGDRAYVTDQLTACIATGAALTGGGSVVCPAFYNGSAWVGG